MAERPRPTSAKLTCCWKVTKQVEGSHHLRASVMPRPWPIQGPDPRHFPFTRSRNVSIQYSHKADIDDVGVRDPREHVSRRSRDVDCRKLSSWWQRYGTLAQIGAGRPWRCSALVAILFPDPTKSAPNNRAFQRTGRRFLGYTDPRVQEFRNSPSRFTTISRRAATTKRVPVREFCLVFTCMPAEETIAAFADKARMAGPRAITI